ncbi:hypothetical protein FRC14_003284 [Serendipita sp. 396]|nr:hypothetical protein FRC14_003284 [Serendipita sp. 396]KAG8762218.1 hypothetical protein FRC15_008617 [Serendipita sp. 397]KAG8869560.1 hypothetical protein FRC20_001241 [Serendipita sp. 405]
MSNDNIDPALRNANVSSGNTPSPLKAAPSRLAAGAGYSGSREGTPSRPTNNYYNNPHSSQYGSGHQLIGLSQTQQIQKLFELNPDLQQLQNAANKATEVLEDEEGEELDDEQLAESNVKENQFLLLQSMSREQAERFDVFKRSGLNKASIKKVAAYSDHQMSNGVSQLVAGVGKIFVGELMAKARMVQHQRNETGALTPDHLREAYRLYKQETGNVGPAKPLRGKKLFRK